MSIAIDTHPVDPGLSMRIDRYDRALESQDVAALAEILTEDFIQITPNADVKDRDRFFAWFENVVRYDEMRREFLGSRSFADTTVMLSNCSPVMRVKGGEPSVHKALMLEVWTSRDGTWRKALTQYTRAHG